MTRSISSIGAIATFLGLLLHAGAAEATALARTWVSGAGSGSACTRAAPCATFAAAYAVTSPGGEIDVLDGGDFGPLLIQQSITIANDGAAAAAITPNSGNAAIFVAAGPNDVVVLRGLNLNGVASTGSGINIANGGSVVIERCEIEGFLSGIGIYFEPNSAAKLSVTDTVLSNNGVSFAGSVWILTQSSGAVTANFERVKILHASGNGMRVDSTDGAGAIDVALHDVTVDGANGSGIVAVSPTSGGPAVNIMADDVTSSHNNGFGLRAVGGTASIKLKRSTVVDNVRGVGVSSGGALVSYSDNSIADNTNGDGDPTSTLPLK